MKATNCVANQTGVVDKEQRMELGIVVESVHRGLFLISHNSLLEASPKIVR